VIIYLCLAVLAFCLLAAAWSDLARYLIPNSLCAAVAVSGLLAIVMTGGLDILPRQLGIALVVLVAGAVLFFLRLWGAGDAKLLAALALWAPPSGLMTLLFWTAMSGGVLALLILLARRIFPGNPWGLQVLRRDRGVPYGIAITIGAMVLLLTHRSVIADTYFPA